MIFLFFAGFGESYCTFSSTLYSCNEERAVHRRRKRGTFLVVCAGDASSTSITSGSFSDISFFTEDLFTSFWGVESDLGFTMKNRDRVVCVPPPVSFAFFFPFPTSPEPLCLLFMSVRMGEEEWRRKQVGEGFDLKRNWLKCITVRSVGLLRDLRCLLHHLSS